MTRTTHFTRIARAGALVLAAAATLLAAACDSGTEPTPRTVATVGVLPAERSLVVGEELALEARALDERGGIVEGRMVTWTSSDETVARVTPNGRVIALAVGTVTIRATVDGKTGSAQLVVTLAPVVQVEVTPAALTVEEGEAKAIVAIARDAAGRELEGRTVTWTAGDATTAEVDAAGQVTGKQRGNTTVTATVEGKTASASVTVIRPAVASIAISPAAMVLEIGETRQMAAVTKDARGNVLTGRPVTWATDNANATVSATGLVTAVRSGYATIVAASEGKTSAVGATIVTGEGYDYDLLYSRRGQQNAVELFVLSLGTATAPVRLNAGTVSSQPTASPDGTRIAFAVSQIDIGTEERVDDVFAVDRTGLNMKRLTKAEGVEDHPAWSPVGNRIAYRHYEAGGRMDVWVMHADGTGQVNLTADLEAQVQSSAPAWSPDGTRIAFATMENGFGSTTASIWTMNADGSDKRRVTTTLTGFDATPSWSPDGQRIAFIRHYVSETDIAIVSVAGGEPVRLPIPGRQWTPAWAPDGRYIAFAQGDGTVSNVYTVSPNGTGVRLRTVEPAWGGGYDPAWIRKP